MGNGSNVTFIMYCLMCAQGGNGIENGDVNGVIELYSTRSLLHICGFTERGIFLASLLSSSVAVYSVSKLLCYMNLLYIVVRYRLYIVMRYWSWLTEITKLLS